jgi:2-keto-4-pentenoate hydratase/2-oxohepta-3-ene-1,7-dioic acid hydratase in catechol pathway
VKTDWEVELAAVIGRKLPMLKKKIPWLCRRILSSNDHSEVGIPTERNGQWVKGKLRYFAPMGPYSLKDELANYNSLHGVA